MSRRVVVTGMGVASPVGSTVEVLAEGLLAARSGITTMPAWAAYEGLKTRLAGPVTDADLSFPRKRVRTMGRVARLALYATDQALAQAGWTAATLPAERTGVSYGSTHGSSTAMEATMGRLFREKTFAGMPSSAYFKFMSHTVAANLGIAYGICGRIYTTCSACTSGSQGIGYGYEAVRDGACDVMICGGAEELHPIHAGVFDVMFATSTAYNDAPDRSPRPYDRDRDGLVVGEGAATLILEPYEAAVARGAPILAEIVGYGTNCDGQHATAPSQAGMAGAMRLALEDAGLEPADVDYINGHGTATELGDIAETQATFAVFGERIPISSTKSTMGHTLGACGAIESVISILAIQRGFLPPTRNLDHLDERCAPLDYVTTVRRATPKVVMNNNFAFGGINTSLVFREVAG